MRRHRNAALTLPADLLVPAGVEIACLRRRYSQHYVEVALDLSPGYLARLRTKDGVPSVALVSLLARLAAAPGRLIDLYCSIVTCR